jgi:chromosome segregation ATPase
MKDTISRTEVPLPDEVPVPAYLHKDPAAEELLKQNQDLMARVTVSLRRVGELELQIRQYQEKIQHLKQQNQAISESSFLNRELTQQKEAELKSVKDILLQTEKDYAKLYTLHKGDLEAFNQENEELKKSLFRHEKFKKKIQEKIKPYFQDLLAKHAYLQNHVEELERENHLLQSRIDELLQDKKRVENTHMERIERIHLEWQIRMDHMEEILSLEKEKNDQLQNKVNKMQQRMTLLENIDDEYTLAKNRAIAAERSRFESERRFEEQIRKMQQTIIEMREKQQTQESEKRLLQQKLEDAINFPDFSVVSHVEQ